MSYLEHIHKGSPDPGDVYIRPEITDMSVAYMIKNGAGFLNTMFPDCPVKLQQGKYRYYDPAAFFSDDMEERADGAESAGGGFDTSTRDYATRVFAWHTDIGPQMRANASNVDVDRAAAGLCTNKALLNRETRFIAIAWKTGVWSTERYFNAGGSPTNTGATGSRWLSWADDASDPIRDLRRTLQAQRLASFGYRVNQIAFSEDVWERIMVHPKIVSRFTAGQTPGGPAMADPGKVMTGMEQLLSTPEFPIKIRVGLGIKNTAKKGLTGVPALIATTGVLGLYVPAAPSPLEPSAGYTFNWTSYLGAGAQGQVITREVVPLTKGAQRYEIEIANDAVIVAPDAGFWCEGVLS
jgi:hypothetical protein